MEDTNQRTLEDILEAVTFIKDNAVTKDEFSQLKQKVTAIESQMVTKEYLDDKMSDLKGDMTILIRKEDTKVKVLVKKLEQKNILTKTDAQEILDMEPFPSLAL